MFQLPAQGCSEHGRGRENVAQPAARKARDHAAIGAIHGRILQSEGVTGVAGQGFIRAFSGQYDGHSFAGQAGDKIEGDARGPHDGLVFVPDQMRQRSEKVILAEQHFMMPRMNMVRHGAGKGQFAVALLGVTDGKSFHRLAPQSCHQRRHRTRIHTAAQEHAQGHVTHEMAVGPPLPVTHGSSGRSSFRRGRQPPFRASSMPRDPSIAGCPFGHSEKRSSCVPA
jgi:hypothetical protein